MKKTGLILLLMLICLTFLSGCSNSSSGTGAGSVEDRPDPYETDGWW
jgi:predicted small secreted protein